MSRVLKIPSPEREDRFAVRSFVGRNSFGQHQSLKPGEFRDIVNWDLVQNSQGRDEMRGRRGTGFLRPASSPAKWGATDIPRSVTWDVGGEEYDISQVGNTLRFQALLAPNNPATIQDFAGGAFTLGSTAPADLCVRGDRLFVFHPEGNKVVEWNGTVFRGRPMGLNKPHIEAISYVSGSVTGRYVYGLETVYRVAGADILVSSPNRKLYLSRVFVDTGYRETSRHVIWPREDLLAADTLWTHLRLWRTKNLAPDLSNPSNPIEPQGIEDELYEVALITRAEIEAASLTAVATGEDLPEGNANVRAGHFLDMWTIEDNNTDATLFNLVGLDRIELEPLPAASVGVFHAGRMWISGVDGANDILYSNNQGTKYSELYDPENVIETGRDGVAITRLFSFERDLVFLKESKSGRLQGGDVDQEVEHFDQRIGVAGYTHAEYLPGIGIIAITNDDPALKILGLDYRWSSNLGGMDFSLAIQEDIAAMTADKVRFLYLRGKILISDGEGTLHVLHARFGKGWTRWEMPIDTGNTLNLISFAGGSRAAVISANAFTLEIEKEGVNTDDSMEDDSLANPITASFAPHMYQSEGGQHILEQEWYWIEGKLSAPMTAVPFLNGLPWPAMSSETETPFVVSPYTFVNEQFLDREYRLYLAPQTVGPMLWVPFQGSFLHHRFETVLPATIRGHGMRAIVDEDESGFQAFDPFRQVIGSEPTLPTWDSEVILHLTFDEPTGDIAHDVSGRNRHHTWSAGSPAGSRAYDSALVPSGGQSVVAGTDSGYADADWTGLDYIGDASGFNSEDLTYEYVESFPSLAAAQVIQQGGNGTSYWRLRVNADGSLEYQILTSALSYKFTTAAGTIVAGATQYTIQFVLSNGGQNGQFYVAARTGVYASLTTTRSAL